MASSLSERRLLSRFEIRYNCGQLNKSDVGGEEQANGAQIQNGGL
jgi:hypothetical protein